MSLKRFVTLMFAVLLALPIGSRLDGSGLNAQETLKIGDKAGKVRFTDIRYLPRTLDEFGKKKAYVLVFTNTTCPLVQRYWPTLRAIAKSYADRDVQMIAVNAAEEDSIVGMATHALKYDVEFPIVKDFGGAAARTLGVKRTPEVVVLDGEKRLRYRGRIDDQYRLSGARKEPTSLDLKDALDAIVAGREVAKAETEVDGCPIAAPKPYRKREVSYAEQAAPVLQKHCWQCHQAGGSAPFSLTSYKEAVAHRDAIAEVISDGRMPPWFASHEFGPFTNRRGLSEEERSTLLDWVKSGTTIGDAKKAPLPPTPPKSKWRIPEPDLVLDTINYEIPAKGDVAYQYAVLPHFFLEDTWVQCVQIVPDNPRVMHHCNIAYTDVTATLTEKNFITGNVPGGDVMHLDPGVAYCIPGKSVLFLEIHFVSTGKPEKCRISVGLRYPREPVEKRLRLMQMSDRRFAIPPGEAHHKIAATRILDRDVVGVGLFSHMHVRGKDMSFTATTPDGKRDTLLVVPNYSFSWQVPYKWEPGKMRFPKGTRLDCVAHFDNSAFNPFNPDPRATVRFGLQTHHEMMYGFFFYTDANERLGLRVDTKTGTARK